MSAQEDLNFLEQMLNDAGLYRAQTQSIKSFQQEYDEIERVDGSLPIEVYETIDACRQLHVKMLRLNARLQEVGQKYHRMVALRIGNPDVIGQDLDWLHELIGACQLQIEKDKVPVPVYIRWTRPITRAYKAVFKTDKEQLAVRWILISALAFAALRIGGINVGDSIKYVIEIWRGK